MNNPNEEPILSCVYKGLMPMDNSVCNNCSLYLETCIPIVSSNDGYSPTSECDKYLCYGCSVITCIYNSL